jgi:hypothetical protein
MFMETKCHCGNIEIRAAKLPEQVTNCNCSICRRYAALWAYYSPEDVDIYFRDYPSKFYLWGDREVEFHHCTVCGCLTHYVTTQKCKDRIVAINTRMSDPVLISGIPVREVDNASL